MSATVPFGALLSNELRLLAREPAPVIWAVVLPFIAAVVTALVPALGVRHDYLQGLSFAQVYQPVLVLFTSSTLALQVLPTIVTQYREYGVLRRLRTTPVPPWQLLAAVVALVLGVSLLMGVLLVVVPAVLGVPMPGNAAAFFLMSVLAAVSLLSLGALLCGVARSTRVAAGIGGFVAACTWFAAGMWVPKALLPPVVASIVDLTPGGAAAEGMLRALSGDWPELSGIVVLLVWTAVGFGVAARTFRFEAAR
ncbi:ABC transporter permease [Tessaracoccus sp. SD287]|uniref:ABC transporter permease n=1 Tax=Tessaracoccus sp. SD287 TaxID=2782008 RepID=UPI001A95F23B|nr:ABC transporter permease [Tessaracoccus sp. SD287]MBO1031760.1 ABC transporter permease [Tessaracoccus sp. SD287]